MTNYLRQISIVIKATLLFALIAMTSFQPAINENGDLVELPLSAQASLQPHFFLGQSTLLIDLSSSGEESISLVSGSTFFVRWFVNFTKLFFRHLAFLFSESEILTKISEWAYHIELLGFSYYFFRLNVLSSQAHPPTL